MKKKYKIIGMGCASCSAKIEKSIGNMDGVTEVRVNIVTGTMDVTFDAQKVSAEDIEDEVYDLGYDAVPLEKGHAAEREEEEKKAQKDSAGKSVKGAKAPKGEKADRATASRQTLTAKAFETKPQTSRMTKQTSPSGGNPPQTAADAEAEAKAKAREKRLEEKTIVLAKVAAAQAGLTISDKPTSTVSVTEILSRNTLDRKTLSRKTLEHGASDEGGQTAAGRETIILPLHGESPDGEKATFAGGYDAGGYDAGGYGAGRYGAGRYGADNKDYDEDAVLLTDIQQIAALDEKGELSAGRRKKSPGERRGGKTGYLRGDFAQSAAADEEAALRFRFWTSAVFAVPLFLMCMLPKVHHLFPSETVFVWTQVGLVIPIILINLKFYVVGFRMLLKRSPNMDTLVAVGTLASLPLKYFDSVGMILTLVTFGKWLEAKAKRKTTNALEGLMSLTPDTVTLLVDGKERETATSEVKIGDLIKVKPGETIGVDGRVIEGQSGVNQAAVTGESAPVDVTVGDKVIGGTINVSGALTVEATEVGSDTVIAKIVDLVEEAASGKAPISRLADRVSAVFVPVVIGISLVTVGVWALISLSKSGGTSVDWKFALLCGISVLVISCPCALGLATPLAIMVGTGKGAREGIIIKSAEALENLGKSDVVIFDKTGTVTEGRHEVTDVIAYGGLAENDVLRLAATLEQSSEHPLGRAILRETKKRGLGIKTISDFEYKFGRGVAAKIHARDGGYKTFYAGNEIYIRELFQAKKIEAEELKAAAEALEAARAKAIAEAKAKAKAEEEARLASMEFVWESLRDDRPRYNVEEADTVEIETEADARAKTRADKGSVKGEAVATQKAESKEPEAPEPAEMPESSETPGAAEAAATDSAATDTPDILTAEGSADAKEQDAENEPEEEIEPYTLGKKAIADIDRMQRQGKTTVLLSDSGQLLGIICLADKAKDSAAESIVMINKMGKETVLMTGDNRVAADTVGRQVGTTKVIAEVLPAEKEAVVRDYQSQGKLVTMVGDGVNDAPAITRADIGIAIGAGTDIAIDAADMVLMGNDILRVEKAIKLSKATVSNIKASLFWAFIYNIICIPVAAGVLYPLGILLTPMIAAAAMSMSSLCVVTNALLLRRKKL